MPDGSSSTSCVRIPERGSRATTYNVSIYDLRPAQVPTRTVRSWLQGIHPLEVDLDHVRSMLLREGIQTQAMTCDGVPCSPSEYEATPETDRSQFENVRGSRALRNRETGEIWERDMLHRDHYEVYSNRRNWEAGNRARSVWNDGRPKDTF